MKRLLLVIIPILIWGHGSSLYFDGTNDNISSFSNVGLVGIKDFSINLWAKIPIGWTQSNTKRVFLRTSGTNMTIGVGIFNNKYMCQIRDNTDGVAVTCSTNTIIDSRWHNIIFVVDRDNATGENLYLDGILVCTADPTGENKNIDSTGVVTVIGGEATRYMNGWIGGVQLYTRTLTATGISFLYNHPEKIYSTDSLKLWLPLSEFTGTVAGDSSGNANNGTISGATWNIDTPVAMGKTNHGSSLKFDGLTTAINCGAMDMLDGANAMTALCWFKFDAVPGSGTCELMANDDVGSNRQFYLRWQSVNKFEIKVWTNTSSGALVGQNIVSGKWYMGALTYDGINIKQYVDGDSVNAIPLSGTVITSAGNCYVGSNSNPSSYMIGYISNPMIFKIALTSAQIKRLYNNVRPMTTDSLKLWYKLNEFNGVVASDSSGVGNNGTISGAVWSIDQP